MKPIKDLDIYNRLDQSFLLNERVLMGENCAYYYGRKLLDPVVSIPRETTPNLLDLRIKDAD